MKIIIFFVMIVLTVLYGKTSGALNEGATDCLCPVTANIDYVCGSNGVTYVNPSALRCAAKCTRQQISQAYYGKCNTD
ncbi:hypothetical protein TKK_0006143 [Trichogramma kaykai]|uniref:Kazal-like domain-containing protein n=1 Tax=Trichogramma kaykai TaxID=54128 RepID=A0ABD2XEN2_9HYME